MNKADLVVIAFASSAEKSGYFLSTEKIAVAARETREKIDHFSEIIVYENAYFQ